MIALRVGIAVGLALLASPPNRATDASPAVAAHFLTAGAIDLKAILPAPPTKGSLAAEADLEAVRMAQDSRTPADVAWARLVERDNVFNHSTVLGSWFTAERLPETARFVASVMTEVHGAAKGSKDLYPRPRPPLVDPKLKPCVELTPTGSYPSGHSLQAFAWAAILSDIFPEYRDALETRAHEAAWSRVVGGVHFPTDLVGGRILAEHIMTEIRKSPSYRAGVERCRAEAAQLQPAKAA